MSRTYNHPIRDVTVAELLEAMAKRPDDEVFRWFQTSSVSIDGEPQAGETMRLTIGQLRKEFSRR